MRDGKLASELQRRFLRAIRDCIAIGYHPKRFLNMLQDHGPVITAVHMVMTKRDPEGFESLIVSHRLDLTVEAIILEEPFRNLFMPEVLERAELKLREFDYSVSYTIKNKIHTDLL